MWLLWLAPAFADDVDVRHVVHLGEDYTVVSVHLGREDGPDLRLYGGAPGGIDVGRAGEAAAKEGRRMVAATNAGMYTPELAPVGLFVADGVQKQKIVIGSTYGNFGLQPNGVFWVDLAGKAHVTTSPDTPTSGIRLATQSGPMLVVDGALHPAFRPKSTNFLVRNGVGVSDDQTVHLVISNGGVRFHDLATLFKDVLRCDDALFLDGTISDLWTGEGATPGARFSGVLAVTVPAK